MSNALWCDLGAHPFPAGQPGSTTVKIVEQTKNQWGGFQPTEYVKDVCSACAKDFGYSGLKTDTPDDVLATQAEDIRERTGGRVRKMLSFKPDKTQELEDENRDLRIEELERRLAELKVTDG